MTHPREICASQFHNYGNWNQYLPSHFHQRLISEHEVSNFRLPWTHQSYFNLTDSLHIYLSYVLQVQTSYHFAGIRVKWFLFARKNVSLKTLGVEDDVVALLKANIFGVRIVTFSNYPKTSQEAQVRQSS